MPSAPDHVSGDKFFGHSAPANGGGAERLRDHLCRVADYAACFSSAFAAEEQGRAMGLLHDLGKYADQFQRRLKDPIAVRGRDHWTMGALALSSLGSLGLLPAIAAAGHHTGLSELPLGKPSDYRRSVYAAMKAPGGEDYYTTTDQALVVSRLREDGLDMPRIASGLRTMSRVAADMLDARMLFSALVDADFLATEGHFNGTAAEPYRPRKDGPTLDVDRALAALDAHLAKTRQEHSADPMSGTREALLSACIEAAAEAQGLFTLSAPTGGGKTLAMLAFALHHAKRHNLRRIVLVMPFLNIIDQTARIYRSIFSPDNGFEENTVLEQHSLAEVSDGNPVHRFANNRPAAEQHSLAEVDDGNGDEQATAMVRLLAQNWDAPLVLTTTVQLFESLMNNRPSRCRKLHRLARSVILFDEAQTLPPKLALATLANLSRLAEPGGPYGATVVFATATQPAFDALDPRLRDKLSCAHGWQPTKIGARGEQLLYRSAADRVRVSWRHRETITVDRLVRELADREQVLCVVNLKRHAVQLATALRDQGVDEPLHLSANMCPAHRAEVLEKVRQGLAAKRPVRLVATQCVEAGVDLDFPVVYRALAPLEAIAQAAGRCNRHGAGPTGSVIVFKLQDDRSLYPPGYREGVCATETFLSGLESKGDLDSQEIINDPVRLRSYFRQFYALSGWLSGSHDDEQDLLGAIGGGQFKEVAELYKLIQQDTINVLVPYDPAIFARLRDAVTTHGRLTSDDIRKWFREASAHSVSLYRPPDRTPVASLLQPIQFGSRRRTESREADWFLPLSGIEYDPLFGLSVKTEDVWIV